MIHHLDDLRSGFEVTGDAIVVGSGPGGAVAAANLQRAGMKTIVLEAGPMIRREDMTRDGPLFLARNFWEGGARFIGGDAQIPSLQGRCLGGSSVVNSAILMKLPQYVRDKWIEEDGLELLKTDVLDRAYERIFARLSVQPTPMAAQGRRNLLARDAFTAAGLTNGPLNRAVIDCEGSGDCITGCAGGKKQSVDRTYVQDAVADGAEVYTCAQVERILVEGGKAVGVAGYVIDPVGMRRVANFVARAPRLVLAAGAAQTPALLQYNGIDASGAVGASFAAHIGCGLLGRFDEVVDPWIGATQGWGAMSDDRPGVKYESLWAPPGLLLVRWGDIGQKFYEELLQVKHTTVVALVHRAQVTGSVRPNAQGMPRMKMQIPSSAVRGVLDAAKVAVDGLFASGARGVHIGISRAPTWIDSREDAHALLARKWKARDIPMTANHIFGSVPMSRDRRRGAVDMEGRLKGIDNLWIADASLFPSPSGVNPQGTVMALSDLVSRRLAELPA